MKITTSRVMRITLGAVLFTLSARTHAQPPAKVPRIGVLSPYL